MKNNANKVLIACILLAAICSARAEIPSLEYQVKASYLYNFTKFVEWPEDAFSVTGKFHLCVVGAARFGDALDELRAERAQGREVIVMELANVTEARGARCHLLFVSAAGATVMRAAIPEERGLLTVGESPRFLRRGGVINLIEVSGRIRFEINQAAAERAGLKVSSRLLRLAQGGGP